MKCNERAPPWRPIFRRVFALSAHHPSLHSLACLIAPQTSNRVVSFRGCSSHLLLNEFTLDGFKYFAALPLKYPSPFHIAFNCRSSFGGHLVLLMTRVVLLLVCAVHVAIIIGHGRQSGHISWKANELLLGILVQRGQRHEQDADVYSRDTIRGAK